MVVSFTLWLLFSLITRLDAPHRRSGQLGEEGLFPLPEIEPQNLGYPVCSPVTIPTSNMISNTKLFGNDLFRTEYGNAKFLAGELLLLRHTCSSCLSMKNCILLWYTATGKVIVLYILMKKSTKYHCHSREDV
jgi:hypothetical protein